MSGDGRERHYHECLETMEQIVPGFDLLSAKVGLAVLFTYDVLQQSVARYMAEYGLSRSTFNILMLLRCGPSGGMQLHELGELLLVSRANVTGLIDHLEQNGFVKRVMDEDDRRARYARLTEKAQLLLDEVNPVHYKNIHWLMSDLTMAEKESLLSLLGKCRSSLKAHAEECGTRVGGEKTVDGGTLENGSRSARR